jgi:hypothetical protein
MILPRLALSVRQPWAWAIFHGKDVENRSWRAPNPALSFRGDVCIHAAQGMTKYEYEDAAETIEQIIGSPPPAPAELKHGGIVGAVHLTDIVKASSSPWFFGPRGLVMTQQRETEFIPASGALGFFAWKRDDGVSVVPAKWMKAWGTETTWERAQTEQGDLW